MSGYRTAAAISHGFIAAITEAKEKHEWLDQDQVDHVLDKAKEFTVGYLNGETIDGLTLDEMEAATESFIHNNLEAPAGLTVEAIVNNMPVAGEPYPHAVGVAELNAWSLALFELVKEGTISEEAATELSARSGDFVRTFLEGGEVRGYTLSSLNEDSEMFNDALAEINAEKEGYAA